jgi:hypothetical protein
VKTFIEIGGHHHNLDMLVEAIPCGPQGTGGYFLSFCNGSFVKFTVDRPVPMIEGTPAAKAYHLAEATATAIRFYLYDRTIQVVSGPYRRAEGDY